MIHHVFANRSNVGDWLSARGIQSLLAPFEISEHLCDEPFVAETIERLSQLSEADLIVIGGGGLFMDYFAPFWHGFHSISARVPFVIWGVGQCDMKRKHSRAPAELLESVAARSRLCVVRDEMTRCCLSGCDAVEVVPCPAINAVSAGKPGRGVMHVDAYDNVGHAHYEFMEQVATDFAAESGRPFVSINNLIPAGSEASLERVLRRYESAELIVAGRLHACIIGLAMGRKVLAVSGDWKVESFMRAAGLEEWVLDLAEIGRLPERIRRLEAQPSPVEFLEAARHANRGVAARIAAMLPG